LTNIKQWVKVDRLIAVKPIKCEVHMPITHDPSISDNRAGIVNGSTSGGVAILTADQVAGGDYLDEPVVEDGRFITVRKPGDLPLEMALHFQRLANATQNGLGDE
jgi:hypothetical protein